MINIKELSVGNWVSCEDNGKRSYQILAINKDSVWLDKEGRKVYTQDMLEPTPITPEILEKNGGFYPKGSTWMKLDNHCRELWICRHTDGTYWLYSSGDCDKDENFAEIRYVHQLQNALTLCGIDKEIELL